MVILCAFCGAWCCESIYAAPPDLTPQQQWEIIVEDPRPMNEALIALSEQLHVPITYEDPPFESSGDLKAVIPGTESFVPKGGRIHFVYRNTDGVDGAVAALLEQFNANSTGGRFRHAGGGDIYNVIPSHYVNRSGEWVEFRSPLDTPVSLDAEERTCNDAVEAVFEAMSQVDDRFRFGAGHLHPNGPWNRIPYRPTGGEKTARDVLNTVTKLCNDARSDKSYIYTWYFRVGPSAKDGDKPMCFFNLNRLSLRKPAPMALRVTSSRPMASVVRILEERFGVTITYEDPPYAGRDVMGTPGTEQCSFRGGIINLEWTYAQDSANGVLKQLMKTVISPRYNKDSFRMEMVDETHFHVRPVKMRNAEDVDVKYKSPWSEPLSQTLKGGPVHVVLERLCEQVSATGKQPVVLAAIPEHLAARLKKHTVADVAVDEDQSARDALANILWAADKTISWQVIYNLHTQRHELVLHDTKPEPSVQ